LCWKASRPEGSRGAAVMGPTAARPRPWPPAVAKRKGCNEGNSGQPVRHDAGTAPRRSPHIDVVMEARRGARSPNPSGPINA
jgi:hypothetical protein